MSGKKPFSRQGARKCASSSGGGGTGVLKRVRKVIGLDMKLQILQMFEDGVRLCEMSKTLQLATSTLLTIRYNREKILKNAQAVSPNRAKTLFVYRYNTILKMEQLLNAWIHEQVSNNVHINIALVQAKARSIYNDLENQRDRDCPKRPFMASKGWFEKFKRYFNLRCVKTADGVVSVVPKNCHLNNSTLQEIYDTHTDNVGHHTDNFNRKDDAMETTDVNTINDIELCTDSAINSSINAGNNEMYVVRDTENYKKDSNSTQHNNNMETESKICQFNEADFLQTNQLTEDNEVLNTEVKSEFHEAARISLNTMVNSNNLGSNSDLNIDEYPEKLKKIITNGGYTPEQVFSVDVTGLFWKRLPGCTMISRQENSMVSGFKASRDRVSLLLGGNAAGDMKLKPLLVYHTENPRTVRVYAKSNLPVIWRSNKKASMTLTMFQDWFTNFFCPAVERYCTKRNIPNKAILLLDEAPNHPVNLNDLSDNVRVEYIPTGHNASLQPVNQGVITLFKVYYLRKTLTQLINTSSGKNKPTVSEVWTKFSMMDCIDNIAECWNEVTQVSMNQVWKKMWPNCVDQDPSNVFTILTETLQEAVTDIVNLVNGISGFEDLQDNDVMEWVESHKETLSVEELRLLKLQLARAEGEEDNEDEEAMEAAHPQLQLRAESLAKGLALIQEGLQVFADNDPNRERTILVIRSIHNELQPYIKLYKEKSQNSSL
ncbi:tigger transposable element-derived protein 1-like [Argonauta hians]